MIGISFCARVDPDICELWKIESTQLLPVQLNGDELSNPCGNLHEKYGIHILLDHQLVMKAVSFPGWLAQRISSCVASPLKSEAFHV